MTHSAHPETTKTNSKRACIKRSVEIQWNGRNEDDCATEGASSNQRTNERTNERWKTDTLSTNKIIVNNLCVQMLTTIATTASSVALNDGNRWRCSFCAHVKNTTKKDVKQWNKLWSKRDNEWNDVSHRQMQSKMRWSSESKESVSRTVNRTVRSCARVRSDRLSLLV